MKALPVAEEGDPPAEEAAVEEAAVLPAAEAATAFKQIMTGFPIGRPVILSVSSRGRREDFLTLFDYNSVIRNREVLAL